MLRQWQEDANNKMRTLDECEEKLQTCWREVQNMEREIESGIRRFLNGEVATMKERLEELDQLVQSEVGTAIDSSGVDIIEGSDVLHCCAIYLLPEYIELLLTFVPEEKKRCLINALDQHGGTPLMVAAMSRNLDADTVGLRAETCRRLMDLGADKNIADAQGFTALGRYRLAYRKFMDMYHTTSTGSFGRNSETCQALVSADPVMEALLRPIGGATPADDAIRASLEDSDDEEEDDSDEENDDDE